MPYWQVELSTRGEVVDLWSIPCSVITYRRVGAQNTALVECDQATAELIHRQPGVEAVELAQDGAYVDDSGETYAVSEGGTRCSAIGR